MILATILSRLFLQTYDIKGINSQVTMTYYQCITPKLTILYFIKIIPNLFKNIYYIY